MFLSVFFKLKACSDRITVIKTRPELTLVTSMFFPCYSPNNKNNSNCLYCVHMETSLGPVHWDVSETKLPLMRLITWRSCPFIELEWRSESFEEPGSRAPNSRHPSSHCYYGLLPHQLSVKPGHGGTEELFLWVMSERIHDASTQQSSGVRRACVPYIPLLTFQSVPSPKAVRILTPGSLTIQFTFLTLQNAFQGPNKCRFSTE